jgi:hypothetical protein
MPTLDGVTYLIGCDPEGFLFDKKMNEYVGAYGVIPGTKHEPYRLDEGMVQVDGLALEFGIDPCDTKEEFVSRIEYVLSQIKTQFLNDNLELRFVPAVTFSAAVFQEQPAENLELGCDPDYDAYTLEANQRPEDPGFLRSGGGHVHIGWGSNFDTQGKNHTNHCAFLAKQLDATLGLMSFLWDKDSTRRKLYGNRGAFRAKPYGMEYRTLSNAWLNSKETQELVFDTTFKAITLLHEKKVLSLRSRLLEKFEEAKTYEALSLQAKLGMRKLKLRKNYLEL